MAGKGHPQLELELKARLGREVRHPGLKPSIPPWLFCVELVC